MSGMSLEERRELYKRLKDMANKPLDCHVCHAVLVGKGGNYFCPECRLAVSHESPRQTMARREFFRYLDDYDEQSGKNLNCQRDELTPRKDRVS